MPGAISGAGTRLSIVVPVLNEAGLLPSFFVHLRERAPDAEVIVVDGGSTDGTAELARDLGGALEVEVRAAERGRARQMNAGAAAASGEVLWFLHADSRLPEGCVGKIARLLADPRVVGGCFRIRVPHRAPVYRVTDSLGNLGVDLFRIALGDHGIFCRRSAFERVGGYPNVPLLEDAELYRRLRRCGRVLQLRSEIETSPRRYEKHGAYRTTAVHAAILALYAAGASPHRLSRVYRRLLR